MTIENATPGPWKAEKGTQNHTGSIVITAKGMPSSTPLARLADFDDAVWPDAYLMAASREMYEALGGALRIMNLMVAVDYMPKNSPEQQRVEAALSKAEGKS